MTKAKRVSKKATRSSVFRKKMKKVMREWKAGELRSGSKHGPIVTGRRQAVAIGLSESRKAAAGRRRASKK